MSVMSRRDTTVLTPEALRSAGGVSLADRISDVLRGAILEGKLRPGEGLVEIELAEQAGVSKTPVREALRLLAHDGLVSVLARRGYVVKPLILEEVAEIYALRSLLEPRIAAQAARLAMPAQHAWLRSAVDRYARAEDKRSELLASLALHRLLCDLAGPSRVTLIDEQLIFETHRFFFLHPDSVAPLRQAAREQYEDLYQAIAAADESGAATAITAMLDNVQRFFGEQFGRVRTILS